MKRRELMGAITGACTSLSGCVSNIGEFAVSETRSEVNDSNLEKIGLSLEYRTEKPPTSDSPKKIFLGLKNNTDKTKKFKLSRGKPVSGFFSDSKESKILLVPVGMKKASIIDEDNNSKLQVIPKSKPKDCWRAKDSLASEGTLIPVTLEPDEMVSEKYWVLAWKECNPNRMYTFSNSILHDGQRFNWKFEVSIRS